MMIVINDEKSTRGSLNERALDKVNELLATDKYGIVVVDVRMKRTDLPPENEQSVYTRMISERESKAEEYLYMGDAEKNKITAETDKTVQELLATAKADAETIRGEGKQRQPKYIISPTPKMQNFILYSVLWNPIKRRLMVKRYSCYHLILRMLVY